MRRIAPRHGVVCGLLIAGLLAAGTGPAEADRGKKVPPATPAPDEPGNDSVSSMVQYKKVNVPAGGAAMAAPPGAAWEPPACWYEPKFTAGEFESFAARIDHGTGDEGTGNGMRDHYGDFHKGDKGKWYWRVYDDKRTGEAPDSCFEGDAFQFIGPDDPAPADLPVIDPEILAGLAYRQTKLPPPDLKLSPSPGKQVVNLETHAAFAKKLDRVWVTASLKGMGLDIAATTVATPVKLRLEAGTEDAKPASCTYDLGKRGAGYAVDSKGADCNITYRRSSGDGTYALKAYLTWKVTWSEGESPDGAPQDPAMPDGESQSETAVTVKEIQSIVRD
ncbi:hypothetical protein [Streptomyces sp. NPDC048172]|uniref:hypothetical protein n=1 Tax=Streptomyces sp. NPDC048172 TaxID=3365505 RepID=UPI003718224E